MRRMLLLGVLAATLLMLGLRNTTPRKFSTASLKGACIWQANAYPTTSGDQESAGPVNILASMTFDGNGHLMLDYDVNINGVYSSHNGASGVYDVDPTGHGSFNYTSPASGTRLTYDFRLSSTGRTMYTIIKSYNDRDVSPRVDAGTCRFQE
jgi:hypothetical protein